MDWINVKDRLPDENKVVDIWYRGERCPGYVYIRNYRGKVGNSFFDPIFAGYSCVRDATHWMPVPEPPKED